MTLCKPIWDVLNRYRRQGLTIVMTTHNMREAQQYSDVVCVVNRGQIVASGSVPQLLEKFHLNLKVEVDAEVNPKAIADCPGVTHVDANAQGTCIYGDDEAFQAAVIERLIGDDRKGMLLGMPYALQFAIDALREILLVE